MIDQTNSASWFRATEWSLDCQAENIPGRILRTAFEDIDYRSERPFVACSVEEIVYVAEQALDREWPALELATLMFEESQNRRRGVRDAVQTMFSRFDARPVAWLREARRVCAEIPTETRARCNGAVYVVLLEPERGDEDYAVYVGSTRLTGFGGLPDRQSARIAQHFAGGRRASRVVRRRGLEPLWSLNHFFSKVVGSREYLPTLETRVHRALEQCAISVCGDTVD
jgi:hypothetical protein